MASSSHGAWQYQPASNFIARFYGCPLLDAAYVSQHRHARLNASGGSLTLPRFSSCSSPGRLRRAAQRAPGGRQARLHALDPAGSAATLERAALGPAAGRRGRRGAPARPARDAGEAMARAPRRLQGARGLPLPHPPTRHEHELLHDGVQGGRPALQPAGAPTSHKIARFSLDPTPSRRPAGGAARRSARRRRPPTRQSAVAAPPRRWRPTARRPLSCRPPSPPSRRTGCLQRRR